MKSSKANKLFRKFSTKTAQQAGSPVSFILAVLLVMGWIITGFYFKWSTSHAFFINNITTIITFLMTFVIQSSQNRDSMAMQLKLNEIIRVLGEARNKMVALEDCDDSEAEELRQEFKHLRNED